VLIKHRTESFLGKAVASVAMSTRRSDLSPIGRCCVSNKPATALGTPNLTCPQQMLIALGILTVGFYFYLKVVRAMY
jgi:hypothetical protein